MRFSVSLVLLALFTVVSAYPSSSGRQLQQLVDLQNDLGDSYIRPQDYVKRRTQLRNCFLSPVQCLLPVDNQRFNKFHKRFL